MNIGNARLVLQIPSVLSERRADEIVNKVQDWIENGGILVLDAGATLKQLLDDGQLVEFTAERAAQLRREAPMNYIGEEPIGAPFDESI